MIMHRPPERSSLACRLSQLGTITIWLGCSLYRTAQAVSTRRSSWFRLPAPAATAPSSTTIMATAPSRRQDGGLCRFNPPVSQPGPDAHGLWPVVSERDWCGHFATETALAAHRGRMTAHPIGQIAAMPGPDAGLRRLSSHPAALPRGADWSRTGASASTGRHGTHDRGCTRFPRPRRWPRPTGPTSSTCPARTGPASWPA